MRKAQIAAAVLVALASPAHSAELKIVDVRRNIPLRDDEPAYKDFYINGGAKDGLKPNLVVTAVRKTSIRDSSGVQTVGELNVPVAQLRVIYVQDNIAVAREHKSLSRDELPMLEQVGVMSGDLLDLKGSFIEKRKPDSVRPPAAKNTDQTGSPASAAVIGEAPAPPTAASQPVAPTAPDTHTAPMKAIIGTPPKTEASLETQDPVPR